MLRAAMAFLQHRFGLIAVHNEIDIDACIHNPNKQTADRTGKTALQPVTRIGIAHADGQCSILI